VAGDDLLFEPPGAALSVLVLEEIEWLRLTAKG
jgi:hypothetical protein